MFDNKYPYTDFHELNLDWFLDEFQKYKARTAEQDQKIATMDETVQQFTSFVTNYFNNLDVQQEINNKLDAMAQDGTLIELIQPYYDSITAVQNQRIGSLETTATSLQNQINEIVAPDPDPTLAEVAAARVDLDGVTYPTLKARIDADEQKRYDLKNDLNAYMYIHSETFAEVGASGTVVFVLDNPIAAGMNISITNNSNDTTYNTVLIDIDRTVHNLGSTAPGATKTASFNKEIVEFRAAILTGSNINSLLKYGFNLLDRMDNSEADIIDQSLINTISGITNIGSFDNTAYDVATGTWSSSNYVLSSANCLLSNAALKITCVDGYEFAVRTWATSTRDSTTFLTNTGWTPDAVCINVKDGIYFDIAMKHTDGTLIDTAEGNNIRIFIDNEMPLGMNYQVEGSPIDTSAQYYSVNQLTGIRSTPASQITPTVTEVQDFAIYGNIIFQLYSNDVLLLIDMNTNTKIQLSITSDHGDCISFSSDFYDPDDEFPLAYISADTNPAKVYVVRITRSSTQLIRTLTFPIASTGYYAGHSIDKYNNILYLIGYSENSHSDPTNNHMIVTSWNLNNLTTNLDTTYTPELVKSFDIPFFATIQGQSFLNGNIVMISSNGVNPDTKIVFIDPFGENVYSVLSDLPASIKSVETEGIDFLINNTKYDMIIKTANVFYYRISFSL